MNLKLQLFTPPVLDSQTESFGRVYQFWKETWSEVYREIGGHFDPASDNLTRQHEVIVLFDGDNPIAMVCHRFVNFRDPSLYHDSYFRTGWPEEALQALRLKSQNFPGPGAIGSQILVSPKYRRGGLNLKLLISFASFQRVRDLGIAFTIGTIRVDRGMDKVFGACGAKKLAGGIEYHGATVNLVYFAPTESPIVIADEYLATVEQLWNPLQPQRRIA